MEFTEEEGATVDAAMSALEESINLAWGCIENGGIVSDNFLEAVDHYLVESEGVTTILAPHALDDGASPQSARSRLRWAASADLLCYRAVALVAASEPTEAAGVVELLDELAKDDLVPEESVRFSRDGNVAQALVVLARQTHDEQLDAVQAGVFAVAGASGGSGTGSPTGVAYAMIERILEETAAALVRAVGGNIASALVEPSHAAARQAAFDHLGGGRAPMPTGRLASRAAGALRAVITKLKASVAPSAITEAVGYASAHLDVLQGMSRLMVKKLFKEDDLRTKTDVLTRSVPPESDAATVIALDAVGASFHRWVTCDHVAISCVRFVTRPFRSNPLVIALLIAAAFAEVGIVAYTAWDHLDSPNLPFHSFTPGVLSVLQEASGSTARA